MSGPTNVRLLQARITVSSSNPFLRPSDVCQVGPRTEVHGAKRDVGVLQVADKVHAICAVLKWVGVEGLLRGSRRCGRGEHEALIANADLQAQLVLKLEFFVLNPVGRAASILSISLCLLINVWSSAFRSAPLRMERHEEMAH